MVKEYDKFTEDVIHIIRREYVQGCEVHAVIHCDTLSVYIRKNGLGIEYNVSDFSLYYVSGEITPESVALKAARKFSDLITSEYLKNRENWYIFTF